MKLDIDRLKVLNRELRGAMATITNPSYSPDDA